ncbi:hypothetical protein BJ875DRAFT_469159 [Amylocarpus encephaloides]|uniref:Uncharacterized protein n=1 Tax=Amylocarpus encephaloides TaxID=45428 RepID=A0A9P8C2Y0_9HELO|nr:hypothetical protein BJ875DRAFT_469159 [Amylocarpus encephaloides]
MLTRLASTTAGAALLLLATAYFLYSDILSTNDMQADSDTSSLPLEVKLSVAPAPASDLGSVALRITVSNLTPHTISILVWSSPLDPRAVVTGVFDFRSANTNERAPCLDVKFNRKLPDSGYFERTDDAIVEIPATGSIERVIVVKEPEVALAKGERYLVRTEGHWRQIWIHGGGEDGDALLKLSMEEGSIADFASDELAIDVPASDSK